MRTYLEKKTLWSYLALLGAVVALVAMIHGIVTKPLVYDTYGALIIIMFVLGIAAAIANFITDIKVLPLITVICFSVSLMAIIYYAVEVAGDYFNNVFLFGGHYPAIVANVILTLVAIVLCCVPLFFEVNKKQQ